MSILAETRQSLSPGAWQLDPVHSQIGFAVGYQGGTFRGTFAPVEATLEVGEDGPSTLRGSANAESIKVQDENLTAHLLSPEFFDAERAPELSFSSNDIRLDGDRIAIAGELTIKGVTRPVELQGTIGNPITDPYGKERAAVRLSGTVDRTAFGLNWNIALPNGEPALAHEVELTAEIYLVKG